MNQDYQDYYNSVNLFLNLKPSQNQYTNNIQTSLSDHEQHLISRQNILLSHILPTESDKIIAINMLKFFYSKIQEYKKSLLNSNVNYIMFFAKISEEIFNNVKKSQDQFTLGVYKHFYNLVIDKLNSMGQNIAKSHLYPKISTIHREVTDKPYNFVCDEFINNILNNS